MKSFVQFITTPTADTPGTTLLLHFDNRRYIVGQVGEGTQRACVQMGARLVKTSCLFLTGRTEWSTVGGVLGLVLTLADSMASQLDAMVQAAKGKRREEAIKEAEEARKGMRIVGARNLMHMIASSRRFIFRQGLPITPVEVKGGESTDEPFWEDENIRVWAMATAPGTPSLSALTGCKRGFDEYLSTADAAQTANGGSFLSSLPAAKSDAAIPEKETEDDEIRRGVVGAMFNSDWKFDHLLEMPLSQVELPASIFVRDPETNKLQEYKGPMPNADPSVGSTQVWVRRPWPGALVRSLPPTKPATEAVSYIIRNHFQRGKFLPDKAKELGLQRDQFKTLTAGDSVVVDGKTISPEDVMAPGRPGSGFAVIDVPSGGYVAPTINRPEWKKSHIMDGVTTFIWLLGPGVAASPALQEFFKQMPTVKHIISSVDYCANELSMTSVARATKRLHDVDPERYLVPLYNNEQTPQTTYRYKRTSAIVLPENAEMAKKGLTIELEPTFRLVQPTGKPVDLNISDENVDSADLPISSKVKALRDEACEKIEQDKSDLEAWASKLPSANAEVITLGTGSALPSKYRNVSATLVRVPGFGSYLFDCGENTLGQLQRIYSPDELTEILKELQMIWISHLHADHHLGTASVIRAWYQVNHPEDTTTNPVPKQLSKRELNDPNSVKVPRLAVISDTGMLNWLAEYSHAENFGHHLTMPFYITNASFSAPSKLHWAPTYETTGPLSIIDKNNYETLMGFANIQAVAVKHCHGAKAVSITFPNSFKISYSGDCRPSDNFAKIGRGSTVLIHEATFDDELRGEALAKQHSTTSEALAVASKMRAKSVVLTHFSQRYQKIPVMENVDGYSDDEDTDGGFGVEPSRSTFRRVSLPGGDRPIKEGADDAVMAEVTLDMAGEASEMGGGSRRSPGRSHAANPLNGTKRGVDEPILDQPMTQTSESDVPSDDGTLGEAKVKVAGSKSMKVCVAFDYMRVKVGDIAKMEYFTPALMELFAEAEAGSGADQEHGAGPEAKGRAGNPHKKKKKEKGGSGR